MSAGSRINAAPALAALAECALPFPLITERVSLRLLSGAERLVASVPPLTTAQHAALHALILGGDR